MLPAIDFVRLTLGALLALIAAVAGYWGKALRLSGAAAAFFLGTVIFGLGGFTWALLLLTFFASSSLLSLLFKKRKALMEENYEKGSTRDAFQVLANGGLAGIMVILQWLFPASVIPWLAASAALAAANADTWATEIGIFGKGDPVLITTGKRVPKGTSGAISLVGTLASLAGSALVAAVFWIFSPAGTAILPLPALAGLVVVSGLAGSLVDSLLGASLQAGYTCPTCQKATEKHPLHSCGTPTLYQRGIRWLNNDWVNFFCTLGAALTAMGLYFLF